MWKQPLCINIIKGLDVAPTEQLHLIKNTGFDGFFAVWREPGELDALAEEAQKLGLLFQSIHAPFHKARHMWSEGQDGEIALQELLSCLEDCYRLNVPVMIVHPYIGFNIEPPTEIGIQRFGTLIEAAEKAGVKIAFENVEGEEHLALLFKRYGDLLHVGFCWDTGHEMCYNGSMDVPALFGDKLICTHLNDNLGQTNPNEITWLDDSHLFPFDGIADWQGIADRLNRINYSGELTFELTIASKPGKNTHDIYKDLTLDTYFKLVYEKAVRFAQLLK